MLLVAVSGGAAHYDGGGVGADVLVTPREREALLGVMTGAGLPLAFRVLGPGMLTIWCVGYSPAQPEVSLEGSRD